MAAFAIYSKDRQIYEIRSEISVPPPEIWRPKNMKFRRDFAQLRDLIAIISGAQPHFVNRKTAMQTTDTPAQVHLFGCTLVHKRLKIGPEIYPTGHSSKDWR